jgi:L-iditol 2-dehydrogenase
VPRSALLKAPFLVKFEDAEPRTLRASEVRLRPRLVGICGSDVQYARRLAADWMPFGHEAVCEVTEIGADVHGLDVGAAVVAQTSSACGYCAGCMMGRVHECVNRHLTRFLGYFAEEVVVDRRNVWPIGATPPRAAVLMEPMGVAFDVVRLAEIDFYSDVVLFGPGPIGLMALRLASLRGARRIFVVGVEADRPRFQLCMDLGAERCIDATALDPVDAVMELTAGRGVDAVINTATVSTIPAALQMCNMGGRVTFVGESTEEGDEAKPNLLQPGPGAVMIDVNWIHLNRLQLRGSFPVPNSLLPVGKALLDRGVFPVERLVTHVFPFDELQAALEAVNERRDGLVKAAVEIGGCSYM